MEELVRSIEARLLDSLAEARRRRDFDSALTLAFALEANRLGLTTNQANTSVAARNLANPSPYQARPEPH